MFKEINIQFKIILIQLLHNGCDYYLFFSIYSKTRFDEIDSVIVDRFAISENEIGFY